MGDLIPTLALECIPGDRFHFSTSSLTRLAPMLAPMMHRVDVYFHAFFVPNRICWKGWESFIISNTTGNIPPAFPTVNVGWQGVGKDWLESGLEDYLGIPPQPHGATTPVSAIPFMAYQKIWNEYYRDQNLQNAFPFPDEEWEGLVDGDNSSYLGEVEVSPIDGSYEVPAGKLNTLQQRAWEHDYYTSSLPFAQKGAPVLIPFTLDASFPDVDVDTLPNDAAPDDIVAVWDGLYESSGDAFQGNIGMSNKVGGGGLSNVFAKTSDLTFDAAGTSTTINDLRTSFAIQTFFEKAARGGTRYTEQILVHFGVKSSDARLQRPEFIGGSKSPIAISEVLNMTGTDTAPQGTMSGHGVAVNGQDHMRYFCEEHGYIMVILSVLPKTAYQQGINKHWLKTSDPYDYFFPNFAHLGEQAVQNKEIYTDASDSLDLETFGYVPRYAEYRYQPSRISGAFRTSLDYWHMGRIFANRPALNADFIKSNPTNRIFAVTSVNTDHLWMQVVHNITAIRPMPVFATPSNV